MANRRYGAVVVPLALFLATCICTFAAGAWPHLLAAFATGDASFLSLDGLQDAAMYSGAVLSILGAHEFGHYIMARHYGVESSLPMFIPLPPPLGTFGTMGAVIRLKSPIPHERALIDIGAAGPLAGAALALPLLFVGIRASTVGDGPPEPATWLGPMSIFGLLRETLSPSSLGETGGQSVMYFGDSLVTWAAAKITFGTLAPGQQIFAHPVFTAAWFGLLVTTMNLMPIGQLDGGHVTFALLGHRARKVGQVMRGALIVLACLTTSAWLVWFVAVSWLVRLDHPPVSAQVPLRRRDWFLGLACFVLFILTFVPVPISIATQP